VEAPKEKPVVAGLGAALLEIAPKVGWLLESEKGLLVAAVVVAPVFVLIGVPKLKGVLAVVVVAALEDRPNKLVELV